MKLRLLLSSFIISLICIESFAQLGPASINSEIQLWLTTESGVLNGGSAASDGQAVNSWQDQSGVRTNDATDAQLAPPTYRDNTNDYINYRPAIDFDGANDGLDFAGDYIYSNGAGAQNGITWFAIVEPDDPGVVKSRQFIFDFGLFAAYGYGCGYGNSHFMMHTPQNYSGAFNNPAHNGGTQRRLVRYTVDFGTDMTYSMNGLTVATTAISLSALSGTQIFESSGHFSGSGAFTIGHQSKSDQVGGQNGRRLDGSLGELIGYSLDMNAGNISVIESYLALKFGITLDNSLGGTNGDYLASDGTTLFWDASLMPGYQNDIIGIGRDDNTPIIQRQSHSVDDSSRIYMNTLANSNASNGGVFASDLSFVMMGNDQGKNCATAASVAEMPTGLSNCSLYSRLEREWKITKTNYSQNIHVDLKLNSCAIPTSVNVSELRILVDDDGDFSNGGTSCYYNGDGTGIVISYSNPTVTISNLSNVHLPNNAVRYMTVASIISSSPLPIELGEFAGVCENDLAQITWMTLSESDNDYFTIEFSEDGDVFIPIAKVKSKGNGNIQTNYNWSDDRLSSGLSYYRLKQTDYDGVNKILGLLTLDCFAESTEVYPNPFDQEIFIENVSASEIKLYDCYGRLLHAELNPSKTEMLTVSVPEGLESGTYYLMIIGENETQVIKLSKLAK